MNRRHAGGDPAAAQLAGELGGRIYTALRAGHLDAEPLVELACLLEELEVSTPATREILERPLAQLASTDLTALGGRLLKGINFQPTFALDPSLWRTLEQALEVLERDVRATGLTGELRLVRPDWDSIGHAWVEFRGSCQGNGIWPSEGGDPVGALASVAEAGQEVIMETIWAAWPVCPVHDLGAHPAFEHHRPVWRCVGAGSHTVAPVGQLPPPR
ncbi:hypothetical protein [Nonomuraea zeae]|uniref:Uncharacterized protein n=1 Tax=Nonomuraea zeae TaxID=1642303 RepID=A0A5S4GP18_9ACTN|nr:hypothetical protein [Nonomuraea zeae]TMR34643.1 hypothetical protein ETD85_16075 [Nonomuraea zeae]